MQNIHFLQYLLLQKWLSKMLKVNEDLWPCGSHTYEYTGEKLFA